MLNIALALVGCLLAAALTRELVAAHPLPSPPLPLPGRPARRRPAPPRRGPRPRLPPRRRPTSRRPRPGGPGSAREPSDDEILDPRRILAPGRGAHGGLRLHRAAARDSDGRRLA